MARILARSRKHLPPRRLSDRKERGSKVTEPEPEQKPTRLADAFRAIPEGEKLDSHSVYVVPDWWAAPKSIHAEVVPEINPERSKRPGPPLKPRHKRRKNSVSVSVSEEEEFYLRQYASQKGLSFSEWVRVTLFKAMGRKVPDRPDREGS
jgi:hypothetical protein